MKLLELKNQVSNIKKVIKNLWFLGNNISITEDFFIIDVPMNLMLVSDKVIMESRTDLSLMSNFNNFDEDGNLYGIYLNSNMDKELKFKIEKRENDGKRSNKLYCN